MCAFRYMHQAVGSASHTQMEGEEGSILHCYIIYLSLLETLLVSHIFVPCNRSASLVPRPHPARISLPY